MSKYIKYRFKTKALEDYRPLKDMKEIQCPWWCSGEGTDYEQKYIKENIINK